MSDFCDGPGGNSQAVMVVFCEFGHVTQLMPHDLAMCLLDSVVVFHAAQTSLCSSSTCLPQIGLKSSFHSQSGHF